MIILDSITRVDVYVTFIEAVNRMARKCNLSSETLTLMVFFVLARVFSPTTLKWSPGSLKQVNSLIFSFLWNGKDKVTRLSSINSYEDGGIKMTDIESLDKAVRLAWLKRIFSDNESTWNNNNNNNNNNISFITK